MGAPAMPHPRLPAAKMAWLLLGGALVIAPHLLRLPLWITATALLLGAWRYLASTRHWRTPGRVVRLLFVMACATGVYHSYGTLMGREAGTALLVLMLALKLLELRSHRDVMLLLFLAYFGIVTSFFHSQAIGWAGYMIVTVLVLTTGLVAVNQPGRALRPLPRLRYAGVLLLQSLPIFLALFLLFPRVPGPLWSLPKDAHRGVTGLSDTMTPHSISALSRSNAVAFRVEFADSPPSASVRYWRGPVLTEYDGGSWSVGRSPRGSGGFAFQGEGVRHTVTLEPHNKLWVFALDVPGTIPPKLRRTNDYHLLGHERITSRRRFSLISYPQPAKGSPLSPAARQKLLRLPPGAAPRARALARELRDEARSQRGVVDRALSLFHEQPFRYTLTPPPLKGDPVDAFLFETRSGFCEHYASAFTVLMRAAGIPARVVTGYQGGEYNPLGSYLIVRQSDAHAWAEVWLSEKGWVRVDPTAAIAPARIEAGLEAALPEETHSAGLTRSENRWLRRAVLAWDAVNNGWNQWVLGYGPTRQLQLLAGLGFPEATWQGMAFALAAAAALTLAALFVVMALRSRTPVPDPVSITYQRFCDKLARAGIARHAQEGPLDFADRVARLRPELAGRARRITQLYIALRYGEGANADQLDKLREQVSRFSARRRARAA